MAMMANKCFEGSSIRLLLLAVRKKKKYIIVLIQLLGRNKKKFCFLNPRHQKHWFQMYVACNRAKISTNLPLSLHSLALYDVISERKEQV
jgi:hypothetical protein